VFTARIESSLRAKAGLTTAAASTIAFGEVKSTAEDLRVELALRWGGERDMSINNSAAA
jgi:hypothetical protein